MGKNILDIITKLYSNEKNLSKTLKLFFFLFLIWAVSMTVLAFYDNKKDFTFYGLLFFINIVFTILFSILGNLASFFSFPITLGLSKKTDEVLLEQKAILAEQKAILATILRFKHKPKKVLEDLTEFLNEFKKGDFVYIMTDTLAIEDLYINIYDRDNTFLTDDFTDRSDLLTTVSNLEKAILELPKRTENLIFLATLKDNAECSFKEQKLYKYLNKIKKEVDKDKNNQEDLDENVFNKISKMNATHSDMMKNDLGYRDNINSELEGIKIDEKLDKIFHSKIDYLPSHLFIRVSKDLSTFRVFEISMGSYNIEEYHNMSSILASDPKLVTSRISFFETYTGLDEIPEYKELIFRNRPRLKK